MANTYGGTARVERGYELPAYLLDDDRMPNAVRQAYADLAAANAEGTQAQQVEKDARNALREHEADTRRAIRVGTEPPPIEDEAILKRRVEQAEAAVRRAGSTSRRAAVAAEKAYEEHRDEVAAIAASLALAAHREMVDAYERTAAAMSRRDVMTRFSGVSNYHGTWRTEPGLAQRAQVALEDVGAMAHRWPVDLLEAAADADGTDKEDDA